MASKLLAVAALALLVACGSQEAGQLTTSKPTPVYERPFPSFYKEPNRVIATLDAGTSLPIRELHYGKEFLMLEVEVPSVGRGFVDVGDVDWVLPKKER